MKNFDIEQLERKNIYKTPDNFFEGMQQRVLQQTTQKKMPETKIFSLKKNWAYSLAAAVVVLFGIGIFINSINDEKQPQIANVQSEQNSFSTENEVEIKNETSGIETLQNTETRLVVSEPNNNLQKQPTEVLVQPKNKINTTIPNAKLVQPETVEQALASFTSAEISEMSRDADLDVYLDLYN
ncbi:MAG: hypothetical protein Q4G16_03050 [Cruoricaptor ignavus]|nr:hypothetical protein [Cruoricaptor ignavus]